MYYSQKTMNLKPIQQFSFTHGPWYIMMVTLVISLIAG